MEVCHQPNHSKNHQEYKFGDADEIKSCGKSVGANIGVREESSGGALADGEQRTASCSAAQLRLGRRGGRT